LFGSKEINIKIDYVPFGKQDEFHRAAYKYRHRHYGGGFGSGKSLTLVMELIHFACKYPGIRMLLVRKTIDELRKSTLEDFLERCPREIIKNHNQSKNEIRFVNGSLLMYAPGDISKGAKEKIGHAMNLSVVAFDELHEISEDIYVLSDSRIRQKGYPHRIISASNPNGHDWVWRMFIDPMRDNKSTHFSVVARTCDNPYLPPDYEENLRRSFPKHWVDRYVDASYDDFSGFVYDNFNYDTHVIKPFDIDSLERLLGRRGLRFRAIDHGYRNPTACLWGWIFPKVLNKERTAWDERSGTLYIYREYYQDKTIVRQNALNIDYLNRGEDIEMTFIDPSCYNTDPKDRNNIAGEYESAGVSVVPANHELVAGINRVRERLEIDERTGKPSLYFFDTCVNTLNEINKYKLRDLKVSDERNQPEEPVKKDDHAMDALRYMCIGIYEQSLVSIDNEMLEENERKRRERYNILGLDPRLNLGMMDELFENEPEYEEMPEVAGWI